MGDKKKNKKEKIQELEAKQKKYEKRLSGKMKLRGQMGRTGSGDSFGDQIRDDNNVLMAIVNSIRKELNAQREKGKSKS